MISQQQAFGKGDPKSGKVIFVTRTRGTDSGPATSTAGAVNGVITEDGNTFPSGPDFFILTENDNAFPSGPNFIITTE